LVGSSRGLRIGFVEVKDAEFGGLRIGFVEVKDAELAYTLVGSSRILRIRFVKDEVVEPVYALVSSSRGLRVRVLKLFHVKDQQVRIRDNHHSKALPSTISNCALTLEAPEARLLGVLGVSL
jgi:hypothetical protein